MRPNNFDLVRLLAAAQVVIIHSAHHLNVSGLKQSIFLDWLAYFPGVPVFFVISGFLVSASYERSASETDYWLKRCLRIFPGLWICFLFAALSVAVLAPSVYSDSSPTQLIAWVVAQLTIFQFYNPPFLNSYGLGVLNGSLWTIPVELQFYLGLPVIYYCLRINKLKSDLRIWIALGVFFVIAQCFYRLPDSYRSSIIFKLINASMFPHFWLFLCGLLIQRRFESIQWLFDGKFVYWLALHLLAVGICRQAGIGSGYNHTFPLLCLTVAAVAIAGAFSFRSISDKTLAGNDVSYGVYIYHMVVINGLITLGMVGSYAYFFLAIVITLGLAFMSWRFVEKPCLLLKKKFVRTPQKPQPTEA